MADLLLLLLLLLTSLPSCVHDEPAYNKSATNRSKGVCT